MSVIAVSSFRVSSCGNEHRQTWPRVQQSLPSSNVSNVPTSFCQKPYGAWLWKRHSAGNDPDPQCHRLSPASPRMHPCSSFTSRFFPSEKSAKRKFFMMINSNWWDLGRFKFSSPLLIFSNSIMYFPWNKGSTCHAYFCDNHSPVFHSMFVIYL